MCVLQYYFIVHIRNGLYEHAYEICIVFGCSDVGVSPDGIEADENITQFSAVDGLRAQTTAGSSLSALKKGQCGF